MERSIKVLRVSPLSETTEEERAELRRMFGQGGTLSYLRYKGQSLEQLAHEVRELSPSAVVLHAPSPVIPPAMLRNAIHPIPVLRPRFEPQPAYRDGPAPSKFVGFQRVAANGELEPIADGELT